MRDWWLALALILLASGCMSVQEHRARQMKRGFGGMDAATQERLLLGELLLGDSPLAAYIALGTPQYTRETTPASETESEPRWEWVYWGMVPEADLSSSEKEAPPRIFTRAETRLPKPGEERRELRLRFKEDRLVSWSLGVIDPNTAGQATSLPLGTFPQRGPR
jgi:hypothetical protein